MAAARPLPMPSPAAPPPVTIATFPTRPHSSFGVIARLVAVSMCDAIVLRGQRNQQIFGRPHQPSPSSAAALGNSGCSVGPRLLCGVEVVSRGEDDVGLRRGHRVVYAQMITHGKRGPGLIARTGAPTRCQTSGVR